jgi:hypothetical protein
MTDQTEPTNHFRVLVYLGGEMAPANVMAIDAERYEVVAVHPAVDSMSWVRFYDAGGEVIAEFNGDKVAVIQRIDADTAREIKAVAADLRAKQAKEARQ